VIDVYVSATRDTAAATTFLTRAMAVMGDLAITWSGLDAGFTSLLATAEGKLLNLGNVFGGGKFNLGAFG